MTCCNTRFFLVFTSCLFLYQNGCVEIDSATKRDHKQPTLDDKIGELIRRNSSLEEKVREMEGTMRGIVTKMECPDEKVRQLVHSCAMGDRECKKDDPEQTVTRMTKYAHTMLYFSSGQNGGQPAPERITLLMNMLDSHPQTINTKLLLVVLPNSSSPADYQEAERVLKEFEQFLKLQIQTQAKWAATGLRFLPPAMMGCNRSQDIIRQYSKVRNDPPKGHEPKAGQPRTIIWAFLLDC